LQLAINTLIDLQSAGRAIGIISHVSELKEQMAHGSEMLQPLAIGIVSGLIVQMPLVLVLLPAYTSAIAAINTIIKS
jgi:multidrug efflux pump subunit AcrB